MNERPSGEKPRGPQAQVAQQLAEWARSLGKNQQRLWGRLRKLWRNKSHLQKTKHTQVEKEGTMDKVPNTTGGKERNERLPNLEAKELYGKGGAKCDWRRREPRAGKRARRNLSARQVNLGGGLIVKLRGSWRNRAKITKSSEKNPRKTSQRRARPRKRTGPVEELVEDGTFKTKQRRLRGHDDEGRCETLLKVKTERKKRKKTKLGWKGKLLQTR